MKGQKGSALLTAILIIFVTVTIGTAIALLVLSNYKLRAVDLAIQRAEYDTADIMDYIVFSAKKQLQDEIPDCIGEANNQVDDDVDEALQEYEENGSIDPKYLDINGEILASIENRTSSLYNEAFNSEIKDCLTDWIDGGSISTKVNSTFTEYAICSSVDDVRSSTEEKSFYLEVGDSSSASNKITTNIKVYYKNKNSPVIEISADLVILIPTYSNAKANLYNLNQLVGFSNWTYEESRRYV